MPKKKWLYKPFIDIERTTEMAKLFPDVFARGAKKYRLLENQVWGTFGDSKPVNFWCCTFSYGYSKNNNPIVKLTDSDDREPEEYIEDFIYIMELEKEIHCKFTLLNINNPEIEANYFNFVSLKTESIEFNNIFQIKFHKNDNHTKSQIFKVLSPSVQIRLIEFAKVFPVVSITFQHNCIIIVFSKFFWEAKHTNFFKRVMIEDVDIRQFDHKMKDISSLAHEIRKYID